MPDLTIGDKSSISELPWVRMKSGGMIDRIFIENFKSLRRVDLKLGPMNLFVGANGSGKTNLLDAFRVLQGIGHGFTISEILNGKPKSATSATWDGIRGGHGHACFAGTGSRGGTGDVKLGVHGRFAGGPSAIWMGAERREPDGRPALNWELLIAFSPSAGCVTRERFKAEAVVYDTDRIDGFSQQDPNIPVACPIGGAPGLWAYLTRTRPALGQVAHGAWRYGGSDPELAARTGSIRAVHSDRADGVARVLSNVQRMEPEVPLLREYSQVDEVRQMSDRGHNFAALVHGICRDEEVKDAYLSWLRQLRPEEIDDVGVLPGAVGEPLFMLQENGRKFPAMVLSDGTLRFAALTAAFFQPDMPSLMMMEEIENGVHASRARLLLELLRSQSVAAKTQVVATTHSATILDWLGEDDYRTTFVCKRDEETGESRICALADVPHFMEVVKKRRVSELFSEGWLEAAL